MGIYRFLAKNHFALLAGPAVAGGVILLRLLGVLQGWELQSYDWLMRQRVPEPVDERIIIVGISETDLAQLGMSILSDQTLANLIRQIKAQNPRVIGLDFYRFLPVEPGHDSLLEVFRSTPNLIGIEKVIGNDHLAKIPGNPVLTKADRVAASDILVDADGRVRRGLLFPSATGPRILEGLGLRIALEYLESHGIYAQPQVDTLTLGVAKFPAFSKAEGGYMGADERGYQILINYRSPPRSFLRVSATSVLQGTIPTDLMRDRIVLIGSTAVGDSDLFFTPYSDAPGSTAQPMYGVELHANIVSQIISTTLNGRPLIRSFPEPTEILLILGFAYLELLLCTKGSNSWQIYGATGLFIAGIWGLSYLLLLNGWWFPVVPVSMSIGMTSGLVWIYNIYQLKTLSHKDELTQLANRRAFDQRLQQEWERVMRSQHYLSVILCDVDYFKLYNDTYGHPQGDECLRLVAKAIRNTALPSDALAARYGGEEFVIVLPEVEPEAALEVAERMRASIQAIKLPHRESRVSSFVTLSLGVSGVVPSKAISPSTLVGTADVGLYAAKREGRDRAVLKLI